MLSEIYVTSADLGSWSRCEFLYILFHSSILPEYTCVLNRFNLSLLAGIQKERILLAIRNEDSAIRKNIILEDLHDRNETLYHRILVDHIEEMAPLIYTPTVGQVCKEFGLRFRRPRGMYFTEVRFL